MDMRRERYPWITQDIIKFDIISNKTNRSLALIKAANSYPYLHAKTRNIYPYKRVFYIKKLRTITLLNRYCYPFKQVILGLLKLPV
jgi:hypothetical protein